MEMKLLCLLLLTLRSTIVSGLGHRDFHPKILNRHRRQDVEQCAEEETVGPDKNHITSTTPSNEPYWDDSNCTWIVTAPLESVILLVSDLFDLQPCSNCSCDYVELFDGEHRRSASAGKFCGQTSVRFISNTNKLFVKFRSDVTKTDEFTGFIISLSFLPKASEKVCNVTSTEERRIVLPLNSGVCLHRIQAPDKKRVKLEFTDFVLENGRCSNDTFNVYDGTSSAADELGEFCGHEAPLSITSSSNSLFLSFNTGEVVRNKKLTLKYTFVDDNSSGSTVVYTTLKPASTCSRSFNETSGTISSPNYPDEYPDDFTCFYRIQASDSKKKVKLEFRDFSLERGYFNTCSDDVLTVYDGNSSDSNKIATFCGDEAPLSITSSNSSLFLYFHTDPTVRGTGFNLTYTFVDGSNTDPVLVQPDSAPKYKPPVPCVNTTLNTSVVFEYGWFEDGYPNNSNCVWTITAPPDNRVLLLSNYTTLESSHHCRYDFVELFDGEFQANASVGKFCGRTEVRLMSQTNTVFIHFRSDDAVTGHGFQFDVSFLPAPSCTACNRITEQESGVISSPNYPQFYPNNVRCLYSIWAPENKRVKLEFEDFVLERGPCSDDYLTVYDGKSSASSELGTFCGRTAPVNVTSSSNTLLLYFHTNDIIRDKGFSLTYTFVDNSSGDGKVFYGETPSPYDPNCSSIVTKENTTLTSPHIRGEEFYRPRKVCRTNIRAPEDQGVELRFSKFDLEESLECKFDHINITYRSKQGDWTTFRLCGYQIRETLCFHSFGNNLTLDFKSDDSFEGTGYEADFSFVVYNESSPCSTVQCEVDCQGYCYNHGEGFHCACPDGKVPPDCTQNITWIKPLDENVTVSEGGNWNVSCEVNHPHTSTGWDKGIGDGIEPVYSDQRITVGPELIIRGVVMNDRGTYTCSVHAGNRILTQTVRLIVKQGRESLVDTGLSNVSTD